MSHYSADSANSCTCPQVQRSTLYTLDSYGDDDDDDDVVTVNNLDLLVV